MKVKSHVYFLLFSLLYLPLQAQNNIIVNKLSAYTQHFKSFSKDFPQEKVYLHFDNTAYYQGENIWFKAYVVRADGNILSNMSKILYVELVSAEGYVVETKKLKVENGQCHGDFKLIATNYAGFYEIRAYTRYMLNFGEKNYFSRVFPVYDKPKESGKYTQLITERPNSQRIPQIRPEYNQNKKLEMQFFPEGGNLVAGLASKVAFKTTGKDGENAVISGAVYNDKGEKVVDFSSEYQGTGVFDITPDFVKYYAVVQYNGADYKFELPLVMDNGYVLTVDNQDEERVGISVDRNEKSERQLLGISISCRGVLYGFETVDLTENSSQPLSFPKNMLPSGVSQITLFNADGQVLSERLIFVNHHSQLKIQVSQAKSKYLPFEQVSMSFDVKDLKENPVETTFSVAVCDASTSSANPMNDNVLTNLLLSSEIKGYIENPNYFFESDNTARRKALDLLLMIQGWTRYSWSKMAGVEPVSITHNVEDQLVMDGYVTSLVKRKKIKDVDIMMILINDSLSQKGKCITDSVGNFNFALKDYIGEAKVILQSKQKDKRKEMYIKLNRQFSPDFKTYSYAETNISQYIKTFRDTVLTANLLTSDIEEDVRTYLPNNNDKLSMEKRNNLLKEVVVKDKRRPIKVNLKYDIVKEMDKRIDKGEWMPADLNTFLQFTCQYYNASSGKYKGKDIVFVLADSKQIVSNIDALISDSEISNTETFSSSKKRNLDQPFPRFDEIESVSFIEDYSSILRIYNDNISPSSTVIALIHLKKNYRKEPYGIRNTTFEGYAYTKEFFSPQYNKAVLPNETDFRRTLYWNPDVKTDENGKATINFYNNSSCKFMNITAETVTKSGIGALNK